VLTSSIDTYISENGCLSVVGPTKCTCDSSTANTFTIRSAVPITATQTHRTKNIECRTNYSYGLTGSTCILVNVEVNGKSSTLASCAKDSAAIEHVVIDPKIFKQALDGQRTRGCTDLSSAIPGAVNATEYAAFRDVEDTSV
jgi:hypothetical protein